MKNTTRLLTLPLAAVIALGGVSMLSGCSNPLDGVVKQATKSLEKEGISVKPNPGGKTDAVPADFPSTVPLISAPVTFGGGVTIAGAKVWTITFKVDDTTTTYAKIKSDLEAAGFSEGFSTADEKEVAAMWSGRDDYSVMIGIGAKGSGFEASYVVTEAKKDTAD